MISEIVYFCSDKHQIPQVEDAITNINGVHKKIIAKKVWDYQVKCTGASTDWLTLTIIKESSHVEVAEYDDSISLGKKLAFKWWIKKVLICRDPIIDKLKPRCRKPNQIKFGVKVPLTVK